MTRLVPARRSPLRVTQQPDWDKSVPLKLQRWNEGGEMTLGQVAALLVEAANGEHHRRLPGICAAARPGERTGQRT